MPQNQDAKGLPNRFVHSVDVTARNKPGLTAPHHRPVTPANGEIAADRAGVFAVVEARAVYFRLPQTCSAPYVVKCSLKIRWTNTATYENIKQVTSDGFRMPAFFVQLGV